MPGASWSPLHLQGFSWEPAVPGQGHGSTKLQDWIPAADPGSLEARNGAGSSECLVIAQGLASRSSWGGRRAEPGDAQLWHSPGWK